MGWFSQPGGLMKRNVKLFFALTFSALLLTMCRFYDDAARVAPIAGLSCQGYTDYLEHGSVVSNGLECYYTCPNGVAGPVDFTADPSISTSKGDLDSRLCGIAPQFPPTTTPAGTSPTLVGSPTPAVSATAQASATAAITATPEQPLLTGAVTMCEGAADLISFRIVQPPPDLTDKDLAVQIAGEESTCSVNPVNPSLLTCTIPDLVSFPAEIIVTLDGTVVNEFIFDGVGCIGVVTPTAIK
jgi:hypothetical protein